MQNQSEAVARRLADPEFLMLLLKRSIGGNLVQGVINVILVGISLYALTQPPIEHFFYTDGKGTPYQVIPLDHPVMTDAKLRNWTVDSVVAAFTVDFKNYGSELDRAREHFTVQGWNSFAGSFINTGNFEKLKAARLVSSAQPERTARIYEPSVIGGRITYRIEFPLLVTYENDNQAVNQHLMITVLVVRTPANEHADGIAIDQINAPPA